MRTTVRLDDDLLHRVKQIALTQRKTLTTFIEEALREKLARHEAVANAKPIELVTYDGGGLQPGVDLDDSAALLDLMEADDADARR